MPAPIPASIPPDLREPVAVLDRRVAKLESERLDLLTEWTKTRDQVIRYMKRAGAIRAREETLELDDDGDERELDQLAARMRGANGSR